MADTPDVNLSLSPEKAFFILLKSRIFDEKVPCTDPSPGSDAADDNEVSILEDMADDPTYIELLDAMEALNEEEQVDLLALLWTGRGDFTVDEWNEARQTVLDMPTKRIPQYIARTPLASDYIEEGLSLLGYSLDEYKEKHL